MSARPRMSRRRLGATAAVAAGLVLAFAGIGDAGVNIKNGNFYISYSDLEYEGAGGLKVLRTYNSRSTQQGMFGYGWGSEFESSLVVNGDGSVLLRHHGGGSREYFLPPALSARELDAVVERMAAARGAEPGITDDGLIAYRATMRQNADRRSQEWSRLVLAGTVEPRQLREGTRLRSSTNASNEVVRTATGYSIERSRGEALHFDHRGRLTRIEGDEGAWKALGYDEDGRLRTIRNHLGQAVTVIVNAEGLVTSLTDSAGKDAEYRHDARGNLVYSRDAGGNVYEYTYDPAHNLTQVRYDDGTTMDIAYQPRTLYTKSVTNRDGSATHYDYWTNPGDSLHYWTRVFKLSAPRARGGVVVRDTTQRSFYEYFHTRTAFGKSMLRRYVVEVGRTRVETDYSECCGYPVRIVRNRRDTTSYEYDRSGRKVTRVHGNRIGEVRAAYDASGLLTQLSTPDEEIDIAYTPERRIARIEHSELGAAVIEYDDAGAPRLVEGSATILQAVGSLSRRLSPRQ